MFFIPRSREARAGILSSVLALLLAACGTPFAKAPATNWRPAISCPTPEDAANVNAALQGLRADSTVKVDVQPDNLFVGAVSSLDRTRMVVLGGDGRVIKSDIPGLTTTFDRGAIIIKAAGSELVWTRDSAGNRVCGRNSSE